MNDLAPTAIIAQWRNPERTRVFILQANGDLVAIERERPSHVWSPPEVVGSLLDSVPALKKVLIP